MLVMLSLHRTRQRLGTLRLSAPPPPSYQKLEPSRTSKRSCRSVLRLDNKFMKKVLNGIIYAMILAGFPLLAWSGYSLATDTYALWTRGVEKHASVLSLDGGFTGRGGSSTFYYTIEMDGRKTHQEFRRRLRVGDTISLLVIPGEPGTVALGNRASSPFSIFSSSVGDDLTAVLVLAMFAFMIVATPSTLWWLFIKGRKAIFAD
jgi:hypothetical protein